ncbi:MICOS complex subunit mic25a-like isoform X1 [Takifugu flavidus]|uniref:MICOS complex subunit mic25a-like isoform X1 n=1 Tax=Takifugu flavidus TaxID=433684 RepID=UPI0025443162|nr:MICOS complex subunit mic25a-like isoform X1 [Takifugu flavidus]
MGSAESTTRKVSFGVDDEDRVRILRGIKLSEDVLQRMRGVANIAPEHKSATSASEKATGAQQSQQNQQNHHWNQSNNTKPTSNSNDEQKPHEWQQKILKEELARMAQKEREAAREDMTKVLTRERLHTRQEAEKAKKLSSDEIQFMIQQLQKKDSQLKALDAFYKEQLAQLENKNWERYNQSKEQFHQAASETEAKMRARITVPVCSNLQTQILSCYKGNKDHSLQCADLAKAYLQCIDAAKKNLLINQR